MDSVVVLVGAMPYFASLLSIRGGGLGFVSTSSSETPSYSVVRRVSVSCSRKRRCCPLSSRRYSVTTTTTDFVVQQDNAVSLDVFRGGIINDSEIVIKPVLKKPNREPDEAVKLDGVNVELEERNKVMESLGEVLAKAEKLETSRVGNMKVNVNDVPSRVNMDSRNGSSKPVKVTRKTKTLKSVWRKGDTIASVQKVVKEAPKISRRVNNFLKKDEPITGIEENVVATPQRPPLKPSAAPLPALKRPVILKDVGASPKSPALDDTGPNLKTTERKTILIDKFSSKQSSVSPAIAKVVLTPRRFFGKGPPASGKFHHKKKAPSGSQRRMVDSDDDEIGDEIDEISGLNVVIPGARRKGRKWTKASRKAVKIKAAAAAAPVKVEILEVGEKGLAVEDLACDLAVSEGEILGFLYTKGIKPDGVQMLNKDLVKMICNEHEVEVLDADPVKVEEMARKTAGMLDEKQLDNLKDRPPVITIMGHVDHGKTTLLDHIRRTKVAASEAGGITQGIGAYKVLVPVDGKLQPCVFLDTPGHEAFGAMRARGAKVTDIAVIVVAADDGIRPQTNEAIAHAKAAGVPIVIAINKVDKDGASPERVITELASIGLMPEELGGDIPMVQISALKGNNVDDLLEMIMLVAELEELKADPNRNAKGTVIEAGLQKSRGPVATFIVQNGTLRRGDIVVSGEAYGKVRALFDDGGKQVDNAGPSIPVQVIGLNNVPIAGDEFEVADSLVIAREKAEARAESLRIERIAAKAGDGMVTLSSLASSVKTPGLDRHQHGIILKVDVQGSIEAVRQALEALPQDNVKLTFKLQAAGDICSSDVDLAIACQSGDAQDQLESWKSKKERKDENKEKPKPPNKAIILGFNVGAPSSVKKYAKNKGVEVRLHKVIYELVDDVRKDMEGLLESIEEQVGIGSAEVRAVFRSGSGQVAGCMVNEGKFVKGCGIRVVRKSKIVHVGILHSLKRVKEVVEEVSAGLECGIGVENFDDFEEGDILEAFNSFEKRRTLEEASTSMTAALEGVKV